MIAIVRIKFYPFINKMIDIIDEKPKYDKLSVGLNLPKWKMS